MEKSKEIGKWVPGHCSLCGFPYGGWGHNPEPLAPFEHRCCDACNFTKVIPERIARVLKLRKQKAN